MCTTINILLFSFLFRDILVDILYSRVYIFYDFLDLNLFYSFFFSFLVYFVFHRRLSNAICIDIAFQHLALIFALWCNSIYRIILSHFWMASCCLLWKEVLFSFNKNWSHHIFTCQILFSQKPIDLSWLNAWRHIVF